MVLIISQQKLDKSTEDVMDWLHHFKAEILRINGEDFYSVGQTHSLRIFNRNYNNNFKFQNKLKRINVGWYRRWNQRESSIKLYNGSDIAGYMIEAHKSLTSDDNTIRSFFLSEFKNLKWLSEPSRTTVNKLIVLKLARHLGLTIPDTLITGSKQELFSFLKDKNRIITKDVTNPYFFNIPNGDRQISHTNEIDADFIETLPNQFAPSLFQEFIDKQYEIRSFFLEGKFYSMAIFSQRSEKTSVDFRNYNLETPNRTVPYQLPQAIEKKLSKLLEKLSLNTASIDLIKVKSSSKYIFLEINPVGQFGMTSIPCNYYLEKAIAQYLIKEDKNEK